MSSLDEEEVKYIRETFSPVIGFYTVGLLVVVAFLLFFLIRWCCCCAGAGCCAQNKKPASAFTVSGHIMAALVLILLTAIGGAVLTASGRPVSDSIAGADVFITNLTDIVNTVEEVTPEDQSVDIGDLQEAQENLLEAREMLGDFRESVESTRNLLRTFVQVLGGVVIVCAGFGLMALATRKIWLLSIFLFLSMFGCFVGWGMSGTGVLTNTLFSEACDMMEGYLLNKPNDWLDKSLPCDDLAHAAKGMYAAMEAANLAIDSANDVVQDVNDKMQAYTPGSTPIPALCLPFLEQNQTWGRNENPGTNCVVITQTSINSTYAPLRCPYNLPADTQPASNAEYQSCMQDGRPILPVNYKELADAADSLDSINTVLPQIEDLANCGFIVSAFREIYANDCDELQSSTKSMTVGSMIAAVSLTLASLLFCACVRNIRKQPESSQMLYSPEKGKHSQPDSPTATSPIGTAIYQGPSEPARSVV